MVEEVCGALNMYLLFSTLKLFKKKIVVTENEKSNFRRRLFVSLAVKFVFVRHFSWPYIYFIYIPQQEVFIIKGTFRVLNEMADNFSARLMGNEAVKTTNEIKGAIKYTLLGFKILPMSSLHIKIYYPILRRKPPLKRLIRT